MFQAAALQVRLELPTGMVGQGFALLDQLVKQGRVVCFDNQVEECLFGLMAIIKSIARHILAFSIPGQGPVLRHSFRLAYQLTGLCAYCKS